MYLDWAQDIPLATAQTSLSESPPLLSQSILYSKLDCETPPPCLILSQMKKRCCRLLRYFIKTTQLIHCKVGFASMSVFWSLSPATPFTPLFCTNSRHFLKIQILGRDPETPNTQKNFCVCPKMLKGAAQQETQAKFKVISCCIMQIRPYCKKQPASMPALPSPSPV